MPVKISKGGNPVKLRTVEPSETTRPKDIHISPDQMEIFGRLRMSQTEIAGYYGVTPQAISYHMRKPEMKQAYSKGRSEVVLAIRQKQIQMALGGNVTMLMHAGALFGNQDALEEQNARDLQQEEDHTWDTSIRDRAEEIKAKIEAKRSAG